MKKLSLSLLFILFACNISAQIVSICSWNLKTFGKTKTTEQIAIIADILKEFDVVAIQEVVSGYGGAQAVARLGKELNNKGHKWEYIISDPTTSDPYSRERYAFLWKSSRIKKVGKSWLEQKYTLEIQREPFYSRFSIGAKVFTIANFHAIPKRKQPETEIKYFKFLPLSYPDDNLIFCGDFNIPQSHSVFNPLYKMGYIPALQKQKTSLRQQCIKGNCLASEYDNFFFKKEKFSLLASGIIPFYKVFPDFIDARLLSDHVPIYIKVDLK